jgi:NAD(P)-dependent dehydrogenase (short-subunit alcohol dehydrogenase family)
MILKNKTAVVTAGASGIGLSIAQAFLQAGASVFVCDVSREALATCNLKTPELTTVHCDVGDSAAVKAFFQQVGNVDILVNNAGVGGPKAAIDTLGDTAWLDVISVNLNGTFFCMREAAKTMKTKNNGCIINISTASVRTGLPLRAPYVASKAGVQGLTFNCARELGPYGISCNAILPGAIDNDRGHALVANRASERGISIEQAEAEKLQYISMRTRIAPDEIADTCLFLASPGGRHISGQMIGVCGNSEWEI